MKKIKKIAIVSAVVLVAGVTSLTTYAASVYNTPAEAVAGITGKSVESVQVERSNGKTYGAIAAESGKLDDFKKEKLEIRKSALAKQVEEGIITKEKADQIISAIEERQANCDGTGNANGGERGRGRGLGQGGGNRSQGNCGGYCN